MIIRLFSAILCLFLVTACQNSRLVKDITAEDMAREMGAPTDIEGIEASIYKAAKQAEEDHEIRRAAQLYSQLAHRYKDKPLYNFKGAEYLRRDYKYDKAIVLYDNVLAVKPNQVDAMEGKALALMAQSKLPQAMTLFKAVLQQQPKRWRTLNAIGIIFATRYEMDKAVDYYRAALKYKDKHPSILNNLGLTLAIKGDYARAIRAMQLAQQNTDPEDKTRVQTIAFNLAMIYGISGDMARAEQAAKPYLEESELLNNLGHYAYLSNNPELAKTYMHMALTKSTQFYSKAQENLERIQKNGSN